VNLAAKDVLMLEIEIMKLDFVFTYLIAFQIFKPVNVSEWHNHT